MSKKAILITGATGKQGGATINALIAGGALNNHTLLAVTRDATSASAKKLADKGVVPVQGDLSDCPALFKSAKLALSGLKQDTQIWGVFSVQVIGKQEETQGKAMIDAAVANQVPFFVYTSVDRGGEHRSPNNPTNVAAFASKHRVEQHLFAAAQKCRMQWVVLRPVFFMDGLSKRLGFEAKVVATEWRAVTGSAKPLQMVATSDIGVIAAQAFLRPDDYASRSISIAGDQLTFKQANDVFKSRVGHDLPQTNSLIAKGIMYALGDLGSMFRWFAAEGYGANISAVREEHPGLQSFEQWLAQSDWSG